MFYVGHLHTTQLLFPHHQLKNLGNYDFILEHLKRQMEGLCKQEFGYVIQILPMKGRQHQKGIKVNAIQATEQGLLAHIQFDCLCFKPQKGDVIDIFITQMNSEMVRGKLGPAQIYIPKIRMGTLAFDQRIDALVSEEQGGVTIRTGQLLRCRCLQWEAQNSAFMKIMAEVEQLRYKREF